MPAVEGRTRLACSWQQSKLGSEDPSLGRLDWPPNELTPIGGMTQLRSGPNGGYSGSGCRCASYLRNNRADAPGHDRPGGSRHGGLRFIGLASGLSTAAGLAASFWCRGSSSRFAFGSVLRSDDEANAERGHHDEGAVKVVLAALPAFGHVYPLVPLAIALERTGAEVVFATGEEFASRLPARTIPGVEGSWAFSDAVSEIERRIEQFGGVAPVEGLGQTIFVELCAPHVVDVMTAALEREQPDLVVFEQTNVGAAMAAYATGVRAVCLAIVGWSREWSTIYEAVAAMIRAPGAGALADVLIDPHPLFLADVEATPPFPTMAMRPTPWSPSGTVPPWLLEPRAGSAGVSDHGDGLRQRGPATRGGTRDRRLRM